MPRNVQEGRSELVQYQFGNQGVGARSGTSTHDLQISTLKVLPSRYYPQGTTLKVLPSGYYPVALPTELSGPCDTSNIYIYIQKFIFETFC